jgi:hypothetical protein
MRQKTVVFRSLYSSSQDELEVYVPYKIPKNLKATFEYYRREGRKIYDYQRRYTLPSSTLEHVQLAAVQLAAAVCYLEAYKTYLYVHPSATSATQKQLVKLIDCRSQMFARLWLQNNDITLTKENIDEVYNMALYKAKVLF